MTAIEFMPKPAHRPSGDKATPVLALHSSASTGLQWKNLTDHLGERHHVFAPDLPGYGTSQPWPGSGPASVENEARQVAQLIKSAGQPVHLVGHSWGGTLAMKIAMALPEWVQSLTLIEPAVFHLLRDAECAADRALFPEIAALAGIVGAAAADGNEEAGMARFIDYWNAPGAWANTSPRLRTALRHQLGQVVNNFAAGFNETWSLEEAQAISCPTLTILGMESVPLAQRVSEMIAETIPRSRLVMIPDAGHMVPLTDPHIVDPLISGHLKAADQWIAWQNRVFDFNPLEQAA